MYSIAVVESVLSLKCVKSLYIASGAYTIAPDFPQFVMKPSFWSAIFVNLGPRSNVVIAVYPHFSNILSIFVADVV